MACFGEFMPHRIAGGGRKGKVHKDNIRVQFCMLYFAWEQHPVQRERLHFYFFEGMTYRQIAAKEGVGEKNIRESINGAVKKIKKFFD